MDENPTRSSVTEAVAVPEPLPSAEASTSTLAAPAAGAASGAAGTGELARAFAANAQALEGLGALQVQLLEALKRNDRSELVLASAQGLNEAFRSLGTIQKTLLERLETLRAPEPAPAPGRAVALLLLGLCGLVVLCTWAVVGAIQDFSAAQPDARVLTEHSASLLQAGRDEAWTGARQETERLQGLVTEGESRVRTLQERLDAEREGVAQQQRDLSAKEAELDAFRRQAATAQNEALKMISLENEIRLLTTDAALTEPRLRGLERELEEQRRENTQLRKRIAGSEMGMDEAPLPEARRAAETLAPRPTPLSGPLSGPLAGAPPGPSHVTGTPGTDPATAAPPHSADLTPRVGAASGGDGPPSAAAAGTPRTPEPTQGTRDPQVVEQVRRTLNTLLEGARARRPDYWTLARVDGVAHDRLRGVLAERHDSSGRVLETVEAREALLWVDRAAKRVSLELLQGVRTLGGQRGAFHEGRMEAVVADGEAAQLFAQSGLKLIRDR